MPRAGASWRPAASPTPPGAKLLCRDLPDPPRARRRACRRSIASPTSPSSPRCSSRGSSTWSLVDAKSPVSFFAYPGKASDLVPEGCTVHVLAGPADDAAGALAALADAVGAPADARHAAGRRRGPTCPPARSPPTRVCQALGALMPEGAIVSDEGNTSGLFAAGAHRRRARATTGSCLTGGAIGQGLPVAVGAAVACPDRQVICLESDGSALYTIQSLWTMAREGLDVTTILFNNRPTPCSTWSSTASGPTAGGPKAKDMLDLHDPDLDFVAIATGLGVPATRATTGEEFVDQLRAALAEPGPHLIEAIVPSIV